MRITLDKVPSAADRTASNGAASVVIGSTITFWDFLDSEEKNFTINNFLFVVLFVLFLGWGGFLGV